MPFGYIAQDSQQAAGQVLELNDPSIREVFVYKYRLQYEVGETRVLVVAFLHGARDFAAWRQSQSRE